MIGTILNITVSVNDPSKRFLAEKVILLNHNPYNRIVENGNSVDVTDAKEIMNEASRIIQFIKSVRSGANQRTALQVVDEKEKLTFMVPDSRIQIPVSDWLKLNGIKERTT